MKKFYTSLCILLISLSASAQWSNDITLNNQITKFGEELYDVDVQTNDDGITYVSYSRPFGGNIATFLQILDEDGNKTLGEDGLIVSDTLSLTWTQINDRLLIDSDGNAILMVSDCRNSTEDVKNLNYTIYKVSPEGEMLWGENGVDLHRGKSSSLTAFIKAIELEDGSYVFSWTENIGYTADGSELYGIKLERLSNDGVHEWDEAMELSSATSAYSYPYIESAGNLQFILVYAQGTNQNIYARKLDFDGTPIWAEDTKVYVGGFSSTPLYLQFDTKPDPNGGIFIGWYDDRFYSGLEKPYISYVQADGTLKFPEGTDGLQVGYSEYMRALSFDFTYNEVEECVYCIWRGVAYSSSVYQSINIQKVSMDGELIWGSEGLEIEPIEAQTFGNLCVANAEDGNVGVFYSDFVVSYSDTDLLAIKLDPDGNALWESGIYDFSPTYGYKGDMHVSNLIDDEYWIVSWEEDRIQDDTSVAVAYAEKVYVTGPSSDGIAQTTSNDATFAVKTTDGAVTFATNSSEAATITIYTAAGEVVATIAANSNMVSYNTAGLAAGVYIATVTSSNTAASSRFIIK